MPSKYSVAAQREQRLKNQESKKQGRSNKPENKNTYESNRLKKRDLGHVTDDDEEGV